MALRAPNRCPTFTFSPFSFSRSPLLFNSNLSASLRLQTNEPKTIIASRRRRRRRRERKNALDDRFGLLAISAALPPLDLTEDNVRLVLDDARSEFPQIFDTEVGMTGKVDLAELDGPFVKISLKGRFWHKRSTVLARISNYLKIRIPEILDVDIEDEKQLDDSPANF